MSDASRNYSAAMSWSSTDGAIEAADSVGAALRRARESRGLALAQISRELCLKEDVLRALESRQYGELPKVPYWFGFVRSSARHLGLDGEEMVQRFKGEIGNLPPPARLAPPRPLRTGRLPSRAIVTVSLVVASAVYGGWYFYMDRPAPLVVPATSADAAFPMAPVPLLDDAAARRINAAVDAAAARAAEEAAAAATRDRIAATTSSEAKPPETHVIVLRATAACWVYIRDQKGNVVFHKVMGRGEEFRVPDRAGELVMDLGNPAAMQIVFDGRVLQQLGAHGTTRRVSLDPKELAKLP